MTYQEVQQLIKLAADGILPGYKGKIELGGTLLHKLPVDEYIDKVVQQTVFNSGHYPVMVCFAVSHNVINYHYAIAARAHTSYLKTMVTLIVHSPAAAFDFIIKSPGDVERWAQQLQTYAADGLPMLEAYTSIAAIEKELNKELSGREVAAFTAIDERTLHLGLIATRLMDEAAYEKMYAKAQAVYAHLQHHHEQLTALHAYLAALEPGQLYDLKYLKKQLN
jgi:hypothetical protein